MRTSHNCNRLICIAAVAYISFTGASCSRSFGDIHLPNKYHIACMHRYMYFMYREELVEVDDDRPSARWGDKVTINSYPVIVGGNITQYAVHDHFIMGLCQVIPKKGSEEVLGYFVIDTQTHEAKKGMTLEELRAFLKEKNMEDVPTMNVLVDVKKLTW